jgi:hypothetical protein
MTLPVPDDERHTTAGLEILLWGAACGRVATAALVVAGLIAFVGLANPQQGVIAYVFLAPLALGTSVVFGLLMIGAVARGFFRLCIGRKEWGPSHQAAVARAMAFIFVAAFAGVCSIVASVGPLFAMTSAANNAAAAQFPPPGLLRAFVISDALAVVASVTAALAVVDAARHLAPEPVRRRGPLLVALAVSYPLFSLVAEGAASLSPGTASPSAALWFLSIPTAAVGAYLALRVACTILDEARMRTIVDRRIGGEPLLAPAGP